jgi:hypothetical protein
MSAEQIYRAVMELPQNERLDLVARLLAEDSEADDQWLDTSFLRYLEPQADDSIDIGQVRTGLSKIRGSLTGDFHSERDERS